MSQAANLWLYFLVVFGIVALPGMDMAYVMGSSLLGGRRSGMAAVGGIMTGGVCHITMGALGVAAILKLWPALYVSMLIGGALYVGWMGVGFLRSAEMLLPAADVPVLAPVVTYRRALTTSLINPKAYIFMLAVFPQFVRPGDGPVWAQAGMLGVITTGTQLGVYGGLAVGSASASGWLRQNRTAGLLTARVLGLLLLVVAALTLYQVRSL
jgi:threonine/homoserine/homoserine lactone efflux protein